MDPVTAGVVYSVITKILSSGTTLLLNKFCDGSSANKLTDGGSIAGATLQDRVRDLDSVNFKLDALSQKDLLSSYTFLKEGVERLNAFLEKRNDEQKAVPNEASKDVGGELTELRMPSVVGSGILNEALELSYAIEKLKIKSDDEFKSAIKRFKDARKKATDAFCNKALSIQDRILAAKFKVVSEILEWLESPKTAIPGCLSFLKDLHSLPAVREIFSVYLNGGLKLVFHRKSKRVETVKSVMFINYVVYKFVSKFSSKYLLHLAWPTIELADRSFNPVWDWCEVSTRESWSGELIQPPNVLMVEEDIGPYCSAVTGRRETVAGGAYYRDGDIKVISRTGESKVVNLPYPKEGDIIEEHTLGLASDSDNNVHVVKGFQIRTKTDGVVDRFVLFVLDENYNAKHYCILHFIEDIHFYPMGMTVNKNDDIIMARHGDPNVYVCDNTGKLKYKFELDSYPPYEPRLSISDKNEIMIASHFGKVVQIYTDEGKLKSTIPVPNGHKIRGLAFHYVIHKLIVLTKEKESCHLLCYSEAGELETSTCLGKDYSEPCIASHPSGVVAIIAWTRITFL